MKLQRRSEKLLKQPPVVIPVQLRPILGAALRDKLVAQGALVVCLSVSGQHIHILAKTERFQAREWMGIAKKHGWYELREHGWVGKLWAKRGKELPIRDRRHQLNVYNYIMRHEREGAWVWSMMRDKK
ncbi:hypothetical protein AYO44_01185 [Planctomycetaceae bacterium SCGC AG-212-F19]|nr:hypothetical protein AYO44_01185 [Planctomycetaceae bacterium SCGC AG-212-F19]